MLKLKNSAMLVVAALCGYLALMTPDWKSELLATSAYRNTNDHDGDLNADVLLRSNVGEWYMATLNGLSVIQAGTMVGPFLNINHVTVATDDFDGDGDSDILTRGNASGLIPGRFRLERTEGNTFVAGCWITAMPDNLDLELISTQDFDQDGFSDILLRHKTTGVWSMYYMNGCTAKGTSGTLDASTNTVYKVVGAGDYDGNTYPDLLMRADHGSGGDGTWFLTLLDGDLTKTSAGFPAPMAKSIAWQPVVAMRDFNGDGKTDLLLRENNANSVWQWFLYTMNGLSAPVGAIVPYATQTVWQVVTTADINADQKADLIIRSTQTGQWYGYLMNGTTITSSGLINMVLSQDWQLRTVDDHNGDGKGDIMLRDSVSGQWLLHLMNGLTVTSQGTLQIVFAPTYTLENKGNK